jgi:acyl carrier protein
VEQVAMDKASIIEKINNFLIDDFEVEADKILLQANLRETLGLDSLDYIDLVVVIESNFGFKVKPEDFISIVTFENFYDYVEKRIGEKVTSNHA